MSYSGHTRGGCRTSAPTARAASKKACTDARSAAAKAMWDSRNPSPVLRGAIQNPGTGGVPKPMTSPKSITRPAPSGARTAS